MVNFHPKAQMIPITPRMAFKGLNDTDAPELPGWLKNASRLMKPGNYSGDNAASAFKEIKGNTSGGMNTKLLSWDRCSCTLVKSEIATTGIIHPNRERYLSIGEMRRLSSFPDTFQFVGKRKDAVERMGNSVPPRFMFAIAQHRCAELLQRGSIEEKKMQPLDFINWPINPDTPRLFTVGSTFSGCGGSSLGMKWAGGKVLFAVEWDENAVATYRLNHKGTPVLHRDISTVTVQELLDLTGLQPGELDVFETSPPCQGFSSAGKRQIDDPRNSLFKESVRLIRGLQPKVFVLENVSGMVKGHMKHVFAIVMRELKASGYQVKCQLMNAMYFGVPQSRERVIFIGVRNDLDIEPSHPMAQTKPITVAEALKDASQDILAPPLSGKFGELSKRLKQGQSISDLTGSYGHGNARLSAQLPSPTLVKTALFGAPKMIHPTENRGLSISEAKRLASLPDAFQFTGKWEDAWARIGNSVPPMFMKSIAEHIYGHILSKVQLEVPSHA